MIFDHLDLHGYYVGDAMSAFVRKYNWLVNNPPSNGEIHSIEVVHGRGLGKGEDAGAIRDTLRSFLRGQGKRISGYDAQLVMRGADYLLEGCGKLAYMHGEDIDRNGGKTVVIPRQRIRLPS